jgi:putative thioredoxin
MSGTHVSDVTAAEFESAVIERSNDVPVLVDFWAAWCGPCRALGPVLERLAGDYGGAFELAKIDTDKEQALAAQFQIRSIPMVMLFKGGKAVSGFPGALPEGQIRRFLTQHGVEPGGAAPLVLSDDPLERVTQLRALVATAPERESLALELAVALVDAGDDEAPRALEALPSGVFGDPKAVRARARLQLREIAAQPETDEAVRGGIATLLTGEAEAGLSLLLEALRHGAAEEQSPARRALVAALQSIEDETLVRDGRRRMAALLF